MPAPRVVRQRLESVDWSFPRSGTSRLSLHALHWFPGNFIPQIPSFLIQALTDPGNTVLDAFCGSGTTGVEAVKLGRHAVQSDANELAVQVAGAKAAVLDREAVLSDLSSFISNFAWEPRFLSIEPHFPASTCMELNTWIHEDTLHQLGQIWTLIGLLGRQESRAFAQMVFYDTLFHCSNAGRLRTKTGGIRRHHWGWIADNVHPHVVRYHDAIAAYHDVLLKAMTALRAEHINEHALLATMRQDARALALESGSVDAVVTSPPYISMIDYAKANRLSYLWQGLSMDEDRRIEIGARSKRFRKDAQLEYLNEMRGVITELYRVVRPGGYCAIVVGESRRHPGTIKKLADMFEEYFEIVWGPVHRAPSRRRVSDRSGRARPETVCVFRRAGSADIQR